MGKNVGHITVYCVDSESCKTIGNVVSLNFY